MPGGPKKGDRRRHAILDAVERLLRERSIAELAVEDIAADAGISRSGFYFYFESKYAALGDTLSHVADDMVRAADDFFAGSDDPPEVYAPAAIRGVADLWHRHEALMAAIVEASHSDAGARALWDDWIARWIDAIAERIEAERAAGRAGPGPDAREVGRALLLMNQAVLYGDGRRGASEAERETTVEVLSTVWLQTIWGGERVR
jgi:AcrR family transcriptional regulator